MAVTPLKMMLHRSKCDGTDQPQMQSRPGRVKPSTWTATSAELDRRGAIEIEHILSGKGAAGEKLRKVREDLPVIMGRSGIKPTGL
jgi:hypothetical protein